MKFIHCADLHLGSKINLPLEKSRILREENFRAFENLCDYAQKNSITSVLICGDMFDTEKVSTTAFNRVIFAISKAKDVDFLYLTGNHDRKNFVDLDVELPVNLKFFNEDWTTFSYDNVDIHGVSFNGKNDSYVYDFLSLDQDKINIVCMHGEVVGYKSNEKAEIISIPKLKNKGIDYLALGHIHSFVNEKLDLRGVYSYSGCLSGRGFDELGQKGFVLIEVEDKKLSSTFIPFTERKFYEHTVDLTGFDDYFKFRDELKIDLVNKYEKSSLIKIVISGERDENFDLDLDGLKNYLEADFFFVKIQDKSTLKINESDFDADKSMRGEFIRTVLSMDMSEEDKKSVIVCGLKALKGEE